MAEQLVKLIRLADESDVRVETGRPYTHKWGLKAFLEGVGLGGQAELKLEVSIGTPRHRAWNVPACQALPSRRIRRSR